MKGFLGLVLLAAIWGGSFLFMKVAADVLGPAVLIEFRVLFGALTLAVVALVLKRNLHFWQYKKHFLIHGLFNSALPFMLFAHFWCRFGVMRGHRIAQSRTQGCNNR